MHLLTVDEAARRLRLSRSKTYLMAQRGELPVIRIGKCIRIPEEELDRWLEQQIDAK